MPPIALPSYVVNSTAASLASPAALMSPTQRQLWAHAFATLRRGGTVSVVVLGGSMARGQGCSEDESLMLSCAYSGRVVAWLRAAYPKAKVLFENRAVGGQTTGSSLLALPSLSQPVRGEDEDDDFGGEPASSADASPRHHRLAAAAAAAAAAAGAINASSARLRRRVQQQQSSASIILMDYAINDAFELQVANSKLDASVYWGAKRLLKPLNQSQAVYQQVAAATEAMLRYLLAHARERSALLLVEGSCWRSARNTTAAHATIARHYGVPWFDFASTLRRGIEPVQKGIGRASCDACIRMSRKGCENSPAPVIFSDGKHPDYRAHLFVASALRHLLVAWSNEPLLNVQLSQEASARAIIARARASKRTAAAAAAAAANKGSSSGLLGGPTGVDDSQVAAVAAAPSGGLPPAVSPAALLAQFTLCSRPTTVYSSSQWIKLTRRFGAEAMAARGNITLRSGAWRLYEDRRAKPGWISTGPNGSTIEFAVRFGRTPRLTFAYTMGYEGFERVSVGFVGKVNSQGVLRRKIIDGRRNDGQNVTQAATITLDVGHIMHGSRLDLAGGVAGWAIKPYAAERFAVELVCNTEPCGKFKILGLRAC